jgi:hypothetical protein
MRDALLRVIGKSPPSGLEKLRKTLAQDQRART